MHNHVALITIALLILTFGLFSNLSERSPISGPMFFLGMGILAGPMALSLIDVQLNTKVVQTVAEITLIIILFVDASLIKFSELKKVLSGIPARLLMIGLPLTMLLGTVLAQLLFPSYNIWALAMLALILSPTDAALGQAVVKSKNVPQRIKESISVESGLNDGLALPPILLCIAVLASGGSALTGDGYWLIFMVKQLTIGPAIGAVVGFVGGKMIDYATDHNWMGSIFHQLAAISLAILAYSFAEMFHGNGFIAAFFAGLMLGTKIHIVRERIQEFGEAQGQLLSLIIFFLLGISIHRLSPHWDINTLIYAVLSLTFIRILPVFLSLIGTELNLYSKIFIGWFGPRGIASILYMLIVVSELGVSGYEKLLSVIVLTVLISTFVHGLSAVFMSKHFADQ